MFTGIIEEKGKIINIEKGVHFSKITVRCAKILSDLKIGDSVAVNGVCLTATKVENFGFTADIMHETLRASSLAKLKTDDFVNLERAITASGRLGGHIVSGHIDGVGKIISVQNDSIAKIIRIEVPESLTRYMIYKGSIAIDGISLTLSAVDKNAFNLSIIPHTMEETTLSNKNVGDTVNIETDIVGRYIEKFISEKKRKDDTVSGDSISMDFLIKNGF